MSKKKFMGQVEVEIETENVVEAHDIMVKVLKKINIENPEVSILRMQIISADMIQKGGK